MRNLIFTIFVILNSVLFSQTFDPYKFFPSSVGNVWEWSDGLRVEFIRDSIGQDSSKYIWIPGYSPPLYKIDKNYNVFWDPIGGEVGPPGNFLIYKLNSDSGDSWIVDRHISESDTSYIIAQVTAKYFSNIFGHSTINLEISYFLNQLDTIVNDNSWLTNINTLSLGFGETKYIGDYGQTRVLRGCVIDGDTMGVVTFIDEVILLPDKIFLYQNYPNPFNPETQINYTINKASQIKLVIYDILGREVETLVNSFQNTGTYIVKFNSKNLPSGVYICNLVTDYGRQSIKMILKK